jgi:hypothetical protein
VGLQIGHAVPVAEMQQIMQAAVLRGNEIGPQLQRFAVCCDAIQTVKGVLTINRGRSMRATVYGIIEP